MSSNVQSNRKMVRKRVVLSILETLHSTNFASISITRIIQKYTINDKKIIYLKNKKLKKKQTYLIRTSFKVNLD